MSEQVLDPETVQQRVREVLENLRQGIHSGLEACADTIDDLARWAWLGGLAGAAGIGWLVE